MYVRCPGCWTATRIHSTPDGVAGEVFCERCGLRCALEESRRRQARGGEFEHEALDCALAHHIDLPSAYSVLLGVMSTELAQQICGTADEPGSVAARPRAIERRARGQALRGRA